MAQKTEGEKRVRTDFNASGDTEVDVVKFAYAKLIDKILEAGAREAAIAATKIEEACMWHVKALTAEK